jgi:hypothetical protein
MSPDPFASLFFWYGLTFAGSSLRLWSFHLFLLHRVTGMNYHTQIILWHSVSLTFYIGWPQTMIHWSPPPKQLGPQVFTTMPSLNFLFYKFHNILSLSVLSLCVSRSLNTLTCIYLYVL